MSNVVIILATYEGEAYLPALLQSLRGQSARDWTLLVRDDDSRDATPELLQRAAAADGRISILPGGVRRGAAGNFGLLMQEACRRGADYLFFADQDDVWRPDKVARQLQGLREAEAADGGRLPRLVYSDLAVVDAALRPVHPSFLKYCRLSRGADRPLATLLGRSFVLGCACLVNRPLLELALPLPDEVASHDWWVALCAAGAGAISCLAEPLVDYRRHGANASAAPFWTAWNPLRGGWRQRWRTGRQTFLRSLAQARALRERLARPGLSVPAAARQLLDRFCEVFERPEPAWRRVCRLHRLGLPALDIPRRLLYYACVLSAHAKSRLP